MTRLDRMLSPRRGFPFTAPLLAPRRIAPFVLTPLLLVGCGDPAPNPEVEAACEEVRVAMEEAAAMGWTEEEALALVEGVAPGMGDVVRENCPGRSR